MTIALCLECSDSINCNRMRLERERERKNMHAHISPCQSVTAGNGQYIYIFQNPQCACLIFFSSSSFIAFSCVCQHCTHTYPSLSLFFFNAFRMNVKFEIIYLKKENIISNCQKQCYVIIIINHSPAMILGTGAVIFPVRNGCEQTFMPSTGRYQSKV